MKYLWMFFAVAVTSVLATLGKMKLDDYLRDKNDALFLKYGLLNGVKPELMKAIALVESDLGQDPRVKRGDTSSDGKSWGIMQIAPRIGSAKEIEIKGVNTTPEMLNDDETSIQLAAKLLGYLTRKYEGDENKIVRAYNQGEVHTDNNRSYADDYFKKYLKAKAKIMGVA